jgi:hypothetical protein
MNCVMNQNGVRQGSRLSPLLFSILMGKINKRKLKKTAVMRSFTIFTNHQILGWLNRGMIRYNMHGRDDKCIQDFSCKTWREETTWGDLSVDGRIILKWILKNQSVRMWTGFIWLKTGGPVAGSCKHNNEPSCSTEGLRFLDQLSDY